MARAAGSSDHYQLGIVDASGSVKGRTIGLPSVTTVLNVLPKTLQYWGFRLGVEGTLSLLDRALRNDEQAKKLLTDQSMFHITEELKGTDYWPDNVRNNAAGRGTDVHSVFEYLCLNGELPDDIDEAHDGYARALKAWWDDNNMSVATMIAVEQPLFSLEHRFAGTGDAIYMMQPPAAILPPRPAEFAVVDVKTSKDIYLSALIQVAAYGAAAVEMELIPHIDHQIVLCVADDGSYKTARSECTIDDFLAVKQVYDVVKRVQIKTSSKGVAKARREKKAKAAAQ